MLILFGLPFAIPSITTPVGAVIWVVLIIVGIAVLAAVLHALYFGAIALMYVYLFFKGMIENRIRDEKK